MMKMLLHEKDKLDYLQMRLHQGIAMKITKRPATFHLSNPHETNPNDRWNLYFYWLQKYQEHLIHQLKVLQDRYHRLYKRYAELRDIEDTEIMKRMTVVGMTTTSAARLQNVIKSLQSRIVIVEEAAEVLESHIIVSLSNQCQHLILIGDHQQLRPSTANYSIEKHFNLGVSLFERMVLNNVPCHVLGVQHRMRPEIAKLIVPSIYTKLENHSSVCNFPKILGVDPCLYFIDHSFPESQSGDSSKKNIHEAQFLIRLAVYLIYNGYKPEDITILAAYSGQMFTFWLEREKYKYLLKDVRITVLDNYQGEECRIILLSLVRNNDINKIGFLSIENRVCVALSRAKEGFYIMGNMNLLCQNSRIWPKIKASLEEQNSLGKRLTLRCQIHPESVTKAVTAQDFDAVPQGGCSQLCGSLLDCGHTCIEICHIQDRQHEKTLCLSPCSKILCENNHQCVKKCHEDCGECQVLMRKLLKCSHEQMVPCSVNPADFKCPTLVEAQLLCGHEVPAKPCWIDATIYNCPLPCSTILKCGHICEGSCHLRSDPEHKKYQCNKPCEQKQLNCSMPEGEKHQCPKLCFEKCQPCFEIVRKIRTVCPHRFDVACSVDVDTVKCEKNCKKLLPCGHICKKKCHEDCTNCQEMVKKIHPECNHELLTKCYQPPNRKHCNKDCPIKLPCGHPCKNKCNEPCTVNCKKLVDYDNPTGCGHKLQVPCHLLQKDISPKSNELLQFCSEPCKTSLLCKHVCTGTCGKCFQGRMHQPCRERCGVKLICGHDCQLLCYEICKPCNEQCSYKCAHKACTKRCGVPCIKCVKQCNRKCVHVECKAKCGDICTVAPCNEPCPKKLKCGHPCIGFCGDPCPSLCGVCHEESILKINPDFIHDKGKTRFVLLQECKHIVESRNMDKWITENLEQIQYKSCPVCKTPLTFTQRYRGFIQKNIQDVVMIRKELCGNPQKNEVKLRQLFDELFKFRSEAQGLFSHVPNVRSLMEDLMKQLSQLCRATDRQLINSVIHKMYSWKIHFLRRLIDLYRGTKTTADEINFLCTLLLNQSANQQISDLENEMKRCQLSAQLHRLKFWSDPEFLPDEYSHAVDCLISVKPFTKESQLAITNILNELNEVLRPDLRIKFNEDQDIDVVKICGMGKSRWKQCIRGHYYATAVDLSKSHRQNIACYECSKVKVLHTV